jgi:hypothetical protein
MAEIYAGIILNFSTQKQQGLHHFIKRRQAVKFKNKENKCLGMLADKE